MLKRRKRHAPAMTTATTADALQIRNLLDDPALRSLLGDAVSGDPVRPVRLDWSRPEPVRSSRFGRRALLRAA